MATTHEILERIAVGIERLAEDPVIQVETGPPVCPHCEEMNPTIRVDESEATGKMAEFVIQAQCQHCGKVFYALPIHWASFKEISEVTQAVAERAEISGYARED